MSKYIKEIDDAEFIEMVRVMESKGGFFDKLYHSIDKTGIQCVLPEDFVTRKINGIDYFWGFGIENNYEYKYILNVLCNHHHTSYYDFLSNDFLKKMNASPTILLPGIIDFELDVIKKHLNGQDKYFELGYNLQKGGEKMETIGQEMPNNTIAWSLAMGSASYIFEVFLKGTLELYSKKGEAQINKPEPDEEPAFGLQTQYEIVLYFKYSGLLEDITNRIGKNDTKLSRIISQITGEKAGSIRPLLSTINQGYTNNTKNHKIFGKTYIENTLNALRDNGFDIKDLMQVYEKVSE